MRPAEPANPPQPLPLPAATGKSPTLSADPFDPRRAECAIAQVALSWVVDLLHAPHRPERIAEYRRQMEQGTRFPPIAVVRVGRYYLIADGHKRFQAFLGLSRPSQELVVECWPWRRWLQDQGGQLHRKLAETGQLLFGGPRGWRLLPALAAATLRHWWRVIYSLSTLLHARRRLGR